MNKTARVAATERPGREGNLDGSGLCLCQTLFSGRSPRALIHSFNNKKKEKKPNQTRLKLLELNGRKWNVGKTKKLALNSYRYICV